MNVPGDRLLEPEGCTLVLATTWPTVNTKISQRILGDGQGGRLIGGKSIALSTSVARQGSRPHPKGTTCPSLLRGHQPARNQDERATSATETQKHLGT